MDGIEFSIDKKVLDLIVEKAVEYMAEKGLESICEAIMLDAYV